MSKTNSHRPCGYQEEAHCVATDLVDQVAQRDVATRRLRSSFLATLHHRTLVQHVLGPAGTRSPALQACAHLVTVLW